jgi:hypothetical protein
MIKQYSCLVSKIQKKKKSSQVTSMDGKQDANKQDKVCGRVICSHSYQESVLERGDHSET